VKSTSLSACTPPKNLLIFRPSNNAMVLIPNASLWVAETLVSLALKIIKALGAACSGGA
jgi:hypothetical protein